MPDLEDTAAAAAQWMLRGSRETGSGWLWPAAAGDDEVDPTLYSGSAGVVVALLESHRHFGDDRFADAAIRGARALVDAAHTCDRATLYFGLTGIAFALHAVGRELDQPFAADAVSDLLRQVRARFDGERWEAQFELLGGNAGVALGALACHDLDLAVTAVEPYTRTAEPTSGGVHWQVRTGMAARFHHLSHGTLGIVYALVAVGDAAGRADLVELGLAGAADVVARDEAGAVGFLVPHSDPQHRPDDIERFSYGWCHGPAGDAQVFRLLARITQDSAWNELVHRCWHTITHSGLPGRIRPGFWDNNGRCCGTAGVLALAMDRYADHLAADGSGEVDLEFGSRLVTDLQARALVDGGGARWSNVEHRQEPPDLEPRLGWAMGNAGIVRELLRYIRLVTGRDPGYAVPWPDQLPAGNRHGTVKASTGSAGSPDHSRSHEPPGTPTSG